MEPPTLTTPPTEVTTHSVYILESVEDGRSRGSYVGYSNDPLKRLRKHNREIKGGAKKTSGRTWRLYAVVEGFRTRVEALRFEWALQRPFKSKKCRDVIREKFGEKRGRTAPRKFEEMTLMLEKCEPWSSMRGLKIHTFF